MYTSRERKRRRKHNRERKRESIHRTDKEVNDARWNENKRVTRSLRRGECNTNTSTFLPFAWTIPRESARFLLLSFYCPSPLFFLPSPSSIIPDMQRRTTRNEFFRPRSIDSINKGEDDFRVADRVMDSFVKASRKKKYVSSFVRS